MPDKPHRRCRICDKECEYGKSYCPEHQRMMNRQYERYNRPVRTNRAYGSEWKKLRDSYISQHPYCELCGRPAQEVHHRVPVSRGGQHTEENLISLCRSCHNRVHLALGDRGMGRVKSSAPILDVSEAGSFTQKPEIKHPIATKTDGNSTKQITLQEIKEC